MSLRNILLLSLRRQHINALVSSHIRCCSSVPKKESIIKGLIRRIDDKFHKNFPKIHEIAHLLKNGVKEIIPKMFEFMKLQVKIGENFDPGLLTLEQMKLYYEFGPQMKHLLPFMSIAALPGGYILAVPLALKYPYTMLSPTFWTKEQKKKFAALDHEKRVFSYEPLLRNLNPGKPPYRCKEWEFVFANVHHGKIPSTDSLLKCQKLFHSAEGIFGVEKLDTETRDILIEMHRIYHRLPFFKKDKLINQANYLLYMDIHIVRMLEKGSLRGEELSKFCFQRGVNAHQMSENEMISWLQNWLDFSTKLNSEFNSFLLVAPALLTLNHPSNVSLVNKK